MAGFLIAVVACVLPFVLGTFALGRPRVVICVGGALAVGSVFALAAQQPAGNDLVPLWFLVGLVLLLYAIWCGGLWLGLRLKRLRQATPG
jgi:predicted branched-subunit amino acid permease